MRFEWDDAKNRRNLLKHGVSFEAASLVFDDPLLHAAKDRIVDGEERWLTIGETVGDVILVVAHTLRWAGEEEVVRIISARRAVARERRLYAESAQALG
jgi:uncharacterized DUF497 family protein